MGFRTLLYEAISANASIPELCHRASAFGLHSQRPWVPWQQLITLDMAKQTLYLIDGNSYLYRAFFAIPKFTTSQGHFTNATYGFTKMLMKVVNTRKPDLLAICFDAPGKSFRHEVYEEYKATRDRMPDELGPQIDDIKEAIDGFGIPRVEIPGVEADDVLGTMAKHFAAEGYEVFIVTSDKDMMQMVIEDQIHIYDTMKEVVYTPEKVKEKMGVWPHQIRDLLGLMGDSSDNIPGVAGVGPKTAGTLLETYESMEGIYAHIDEIKGKTQEKLRNDHDKAILSKDLATVKTDVEVDFSTVVPFTPDWTTLKELFRQLEFSSILKEITTPENYQEIVQEDDVDKDYRAIVTEDAYEKLLKRMGQAKRCAIDTETTSENPMEADLMGLSFSFRAYESYYIPVSQHEGLQQHLDKTYVLEKLRPLLEDRSVEKVGQNIKYDLLVLARAYRRLGMPNTNADTPSQMPLF